MMGQNSGCKLSVGRDKINKCESRHRINTAHIVIVAGSSCMPAWQHTRSGGF